MFSGLTNQMSSWIGNTGKKPDGEVQPTEDEQPVSSPVLEDSNAATDGENKKDISPTKGSRLDMLGNLGSVKTNFGQVTSWLGGGIPGLRKGEGDPMAGVAGEGIEGTGQPTEPPPSAPEKAPKGEGGEKEDDDNSSATGGADSEGHVSEEDTGEDKDGQQAFGAERRMKREDSCLDLSALSIRFHDPSSLPHAYGYLTTKALAGAKSIGGFLFSAVNKAGKTVSEASAKIKKTVEDNSLLGEFNKEQEAFIKEKQGKGGDAAVPPWVGWPNEESLKEECLSLSSDRRNFVRSPPAGVDFQFDYEVSYPIALATLAEDPNLEKMRFELVPKVINEENFWRNYFYRVSLICQASELNSMAQEGGNLDTRTTSADDENAVKPTQSNEESSQFHSNSGAAAGNTDSPLHEFVSDTFSASSQDIQEVREGMKKLGMDPTPVNEEEWEKELEAELQDYEVVAENANGQTKKDSSWGRDVDDLLEHEEDLK